MLGLGSRRNALAVSVGWWLVRRRLRKRARAATARLAAGRGPSLARRCGPCRLPAILLAALLVAGLLFAWYRLRRDGGGDPGAWEHEVPVAPPATSVPAPGLSLSGS